MRDLGHRARTLTSAALAGSAVAVTAVTGLADGHATAPSAAWTARAIHAGAVLPSVLPTELPTALPTLPAVLPTATPSPLPIPSVTPSAGRQKTPSPSSTPNPGAVTGATPTGARSGPPSPAGSAGDGGAAAASGAPGGASAATTAGEGPPNRPPAAAGAPAATSASPPSHSRPEPAAPLDSILAGLTQERVITVPALGAIVPFLIGVVLILFFGWRRWRREREAARRMAELERAQSGFLQMASHELRTPLSVLRGYVSMIGDGTIGAMPAELQAVLPVMASKIDQIDQLIEEMLDVARLEESRLWLDREIIDLRSAAGEAVTIARLRATGRHQIVVEVPTTEVRVEADRARLVQVLTQLLDNAIKFSPDGGRITCSVEAFEDGRREALVRVSDEGIGIAAADLPRLFTRFGRLVTPENSHIFGAGLGLYLARELARMHGGELTAEAGRDEEAGTAFALRLPLAVAVEERQVLSVPAEAIQVRGGGAGG